MRRQPIFPESETSKIINPSNIIELQTGATHDVIVGPVSIAVGSLQTSNADLAQRFGTSPEVILRKTGIESRPLATPDTTPKELALAAAAPLYSHPDFDPASLLLIITSTSSVSQVCPPLSCEILKTIQETHTATADIMAFDLMATCTGWLYAIALASDQLQQPHNRSKSALIITTEVFSQGIAHDDFAAWATFGDAATATLIFGPDAKPANAAANQYLRMDRPYCFAHGDTDGILWGPPLNMDAKLKMDGYALRQQSLPSMLKGLRAAMEPVNLTASDLDAILAHQSSQRILADIATELGVNSDIMATNMRTRGNTSSSSLPLLIHDLRRQLPQTTLTAGAQLGFTAFGGGFTYGGATARVIG